MSNFNDKNLQTSYQVRQQLNTLSIDDPDVKNRLTGMVDKLQCLDRVIRAVGLAGREFSFASRVAWGKLFAAVKDKSDDSSAQLDTAAEVVERSEEQLQQQLIPKLRRWRNRWMLQVLLLDVMLLVLLLLPVAIMLWQQGMNTTDMLVFVRDMFYTRPWFSFSVTIMLSLFVLFAHFSARNYVAARLSRQLLREGSEFDFVTAFRRNTRVCHSIFRPDVVGWNWLNLKCLHRQAE